MFTEKYFCICVNLQCEIFQKKKKKENKMSEKLQTFDIPQNYSALLNKLEKLAIDLDVNLENITLAKKEVEISINTADSGLTVADHVPVISASPVDTRYISDIWIGVILTLLIVSIIFFICSCFLYHKFQQWKNTCEFN